MYDFYYEDNFFFAENEENINFQMRKQNIVDVKNSRFLTVTESENLFNYN